MDGQKINKNQGIQVISRAADILRLLGEETGGLSLGQIAGRVGLPRSTVQRIVSALSVEGFVSTELGNGGIRLGPEIQSLAQASAADFKERIRPLMKRISEATGETVDLAIVAGRKMLFVDQIVGSQRLRTVSSIGETFPMSTTANGKAALACMDQADAAKIIIEEQSGLEPPAKSLSDILNELSDIQTGTLAADEGEHTEGICALGFAVKDIRGEIYAVSVPVPSTRYHRRKNELLKAIADCRKELPS